MKTDLIFAIIALSVISLATSANVCSKFSCSSTEKTNCATKTAEFTYTLANICTQDSQFCPYLKTTLEKAQVACENRQNKFRSYPGGSCTTNDDCINGVTCDVDYKTCVKANEGDDCTKNADCIIGTFCNLEDGKKKCRKQAVDLDCFDDYMCPNTHGCVDLAVGDFSKGECLEYFSIKSGNPVPKNNNISFCESSFAVSETVDGKQQDYCVDASLVLAQGQTVKECLKDEDCSYEYTFKGVKKSTTYSGSCQCGYNNSGKKYCTPANLNLPKYSDFVKKTKNLLAVSQCHTDERFSCSHILRKTAYKFYDLKKTEVDVMKQYLLTGAEDCTRDVVFPNYKKDLKLPTCPVFTCTENKDPAKTVCATSPGYLSNDYKVKVESCAATGAKCKFTPSDFFQEDTRTDSCVIPDAPKNFAYPGEKCAKDDDCVQVTIKGEVKATCDKTSFVCVGNNKTEGCLTDKDCVVGTFCKTNQDASKSCSDLLGLDGTCTKTTECQNTLICYNTKCTTPFTQPLGTNLTGKIEDHYKNLACATNYFYHNTCAEKRYSESRSTVDAGVVKCNFGDSCYYDIKLKDNDVRTITEDCFCGFNSSATGYCPYSIHDYNNNRNKKIKDTYIAALGKPKSHTLNRLSFATPEDGQCLSVYANSSYHKADDCILKVLGQGICQSIPDDSSSSSSSISPSESSSKSPSSSGYLKYAFTLLLLIALAL